MSLVKILCGLIRSWYSRMAWRLEPEVWTTEVVDSMPVMALRSFSRLNVAVLIPGMDWMTAAWAAVSMSLRRGGLKVR